MTKLIYTFGNGSAEGTSQMRNLLGGKGANLAEMSNIGLNVPSGFTISTDVCKHFYDNEKTYPKDLEIQIKESIKFVETILGSKFGCVENPLLFSVRSGARVSMPGMMDTVLNLGLNDKTIVGLINKSNDERFAWDSYRRFIQMYSNVVLNIEHYLFEELLDARKDVAGAMLDTELSANDLKELVSDYKRLVKNEINIDFPEDPWEQLMKAVSAVFESWETPRANVYRKLHGYDNSWGTAVNVQAMVFGNMGKNCATGVAFTRNPSTGENSFYGEYLINAQGEDVVAGIRTPQTLTIKDKEEQESTLPSMEEAMPDVFKQLDDVRNILEKHYKDMQDIEFTVQNNKLFMLQTRSGKRTANAAIKIAYDMVDEKLIDKNEALLRIDANNLDQVLHPTLDPTAEKEIIANGLPASPGSASGYVVFSADEAENYVKEGKDTILVRIETSPDDIHGMHAAKGILTTRGGMTSHAAVVARGMGRPCVSGAGDIEISYEKKQFKVSSYIVKEDDFITIDGSSGDIILGQVPSIQPKMSKEFTAIMKWADDIRELKIRTNADSPKDARVARNFGAEGIGLCRTEHMFFNDERILAVREMILSNSKEEREKALHKILPMQRHDFEEIFKEMDGLPVTIRLLDPPLHEFLPHTDKEFNELEKKLSISKEKVISKTRSLHEFNPMLGHRGCRLLITYPEICEMQARAIFEAALNVKKEGVNAVVEVMIPLVSLENEFNFLKGVIDNVAKELNDKNNEKIEYTVGTMIELPRAALNADKIATNANFFSFGTNDLTQTTYGLSRDDSANFMNYYQQNGIINFDPFQSIDVDGVGALIKIAEEKGKKVNPNIKLGICGEHGGDPKSIDFCYEIGLNYVSCSPFRVPVARLAAAQASIKSKIK